MDRNNIIGLVLIFAIIMVSTYWLGPSTEELKKEEALQDSLLKTPQQNEPTQQVKQTQVPNTENINQENSQPVSDQPKQEEEFFTLQNENLTVKISNVGANIHRVRLNNYKDHKGDDVVLMKDGNNHLYFDIPLNDKIVSTKGLFFKKKSGISGDSQNVVLELVDQLGQTLLTYKYTLLPQAFKVNLSVELSNKLKQSFLSNTIPMKWDATLYPQEKSLRNERLESTIYFMQDDGDWDYLSKSGDDEESIKEHDLKWISYKQLFFNCTLIPNTPVTNADLKVISASDDLIVKEYESTFTSHIQNNVIQFDWVFAPNQNSILEDIDDDLTVIIFRGYWILKYINYVVLKIFELFTSFNINVGVIIILLTIILKIVIFPLTYKSYVSMAKMRVLKPELDQIKEKVGNNQQLLQQEYLKLYRQAGVNPLGGCIPMLLQMPIIMSFFFFFPNLFELRQESFLWIEDLSTYDAIITFSPIPIIGMGHVSLMCLLFTISQVFYTHFNSQMTSGTGGAMATQFKIMGYIFPIIFFGVLNSYAAGLNFYYLCANLITFAQQYVIRKRVNDEKIHAKLQQNKKKNKGSKKSAFQTKLEKYMNEKKAEMEKKRKTLHKRK